MIMEQAMKRSEDIETQAMESQKINKAFRKKVPMTVSLGRRKRHHHISMDSIKYYKYFIHSGMMSMDPRNEHVKLMLEGLTTNILSTTM